MYSDDMIKALLETVKPHLEKIKLNIHSIDAGLLRFTVTSELDDNAKYHMILETDKDYTAYELFNDAQNLEPVK